jgi:hypothetical protein
LDRLLSLFITIWITYSVSIGIAGWCLGDLAGDRRKWRSLIPGWNVVYLFQLAGRSIHEALLVIACFLVAPVVGVFVLVPLGGALMTRTGRHRAFGILLTMPPIGWLGLPILGLSAERFYVGTKSRGDAVNAFKLDHWFRWH